MAQLTPGGTLMQIARALVIATSFALLGGCASEVVRIAEPLQAVSEAERKWIEITEDAQIVFASGYGRTLPAGSLWEHRGNVRQGAAYRRIKGVFTIEGAHVHEAYIVISNDQLVGFYLPVEQAYSPAQPVSLKLRPRENR